MKKNKNEIYVALVIDDITKEIVYSVKTYDEADDVVTDLNESEGSFERYFVDEIYLNEEQILHYSKKV